MDKKKVLDISELDQKKKITYNDLLHADTVSKSEKKDNINKIMIFKYIAVTIVLFAIIFGSLLLFRKV